MIDRLVIPALDYVTFTHCVAFQSHMLQAFYFPPPVATASLLRLRGAGRTWSRITNQTEASGVHGESARGRRGRASPSRLTSRPGAVQTAVVFAGTAAHWRVNALSLSPGRAPARRPQAPRRRSRRRSADAPDPDAICLRAGGENAPAFAAFPCFAGGERRSSCRRRPSRPKRARSLSGIRIARGAVERRRRGRRSETCGGFFEE